MNLPVAPDDGIRNHWSCWSGEPRTTREAITHCQYCREAIPNHTEGCIVPLRTVVVEFKAQMVIAVPRISSPEDINFSMNDSSACMSRYVEQLQAEANQEQGMCHICGRSEMKYLREATLGDHESLSYTYIR